MGKTHIWKLWHCTRSVIQDQNLVFCLRDGVVWYFKYSAILCSYLISETIHMLETTQVSQKMYLLYINT